MFINLVNTDIPFEEYQLSQDKIDALKFQLLLSEGYLNAYELQDEQDPFDCYNVFLLFLEGKLLFLLVGNARAIEDGYPFMCMVDMSGEFPRRLDSEEMIDFICDAYHLNQNTPITCSLVSLDNEIDRIVITQKLEDELEYIIKARRRTPKEEIKEVSAALRHYEEYDKPAKRNVDYELSATELEEMERLKHIFLKKIYNFDYKPNSDK